MWDELRPIKSIPAHSNIVQFDHVVVDDAESRILWFTTIFVPDGILDENKSRIFRFEWLQQLTAVVLVKL